MAVFTVSSLSDDTVMRIMSCTLIDDPASVLEGLSELTLTYVDFAGREQTGMMICDSTLADDLIYIFKELFYAGYQIEKIKPSDEYCGNDDLIMADNCTSCFNYRCVDGTDTLSMHAFGRAVDINPLYNPYIVKGRILPPNGAEYADRTKDFPHKIDEDDLCYRLFTKRGWSWGGHWTSEKDYQHFYKQ